jgi:hypothetical protein
VGTGGVISSRRAGGCHPEGQSTRLGDVPCTPPLGPAGLHPRREITTEAGAHGRVADVEAAKQLRNACDQQVPGDDPGSGEAPGGPIFGFIRLRSPVFISIQIQYTLQVTDVNGLWRTVIPTPENRKVSGPPASLPPATADA